MKLTKNFDHTEFLSPDKPTLPGVVLIAIKDLCIYILQPLRDYMESPIKINSGYRTPGHNRAVNGVPYSDHLKGFAADIDTADNKKAFEWLKNNTKFKQLINEHNYRWIHVSYDEKNLKQEIINIP